MKNTNITLGYTGITAFLILGSSAYGLGNKVWHKGDPWPYPRSILRAVVHAKVTDNKLYYSYWYEVQNSTASDLPIFNFEIDVSLDADPLGLFTLNGNIVSATQHDSVTKAFTNIPKIHVVRKSPPVGWNVNISSGNLSIDNALWFVSQPSDTYVIHPRINLNGFLLEAAEPPGVRRFVVHANETIMQYETFIRRLLPEQVAFYENSEEFMREINKPLEFINFTIAPVAPPEPFTASAWTARMLSDAIEARKLGWIRTDEQLTKIKGLISTLNTESRHKLKKAMNEIERYVLAEKKAGRLTDEADALVRLNALYLLRRTEKDPKVLK